MIIIIFLHFALYSISRKFSNPSHCYSEYIRRSKRESGSKELNENCVQRNGNIKLYLLYLVHALDFLCPTTTPGNDTRLCTVLHGSYMDNLSLSRFFFCVQALLDLQGMSYNVLTAVAIRNDVA